MLRSSVTSSLEVWKFTSVLQDIGSLGLLPCSHPITLKLQQSRGLGTTDHIISLDDLLCMSVEGVTWGVDGGRTPLPTHLLQYCNPALLVHPFIRS